MTSLNALFLAVEFEKLNLINTNRIWACRRIMQFQTNIQGYTNKYGRFIQNNRQNYWTEM